MSFKQSDIVYAYVRFRGKVNGGRQRPVLIFQTPDGKWMGLRITSKYEGKPEAIRHYFYEIRDWQKAGLAKPSWIDTKFQINVANLEVIHVFGHLTLRDKQEFRAFLQNVF